MSSVQCNNDHDDFCYMCGHYVFHMKRQTTIRVRRYKVDAPKLVEEYRKTFNQDSLQRSEDWSPSEVCLKCYHELTVPGRPKRILAPMEWIEPENHPHDRFFCRTVIPIGINKRRKDLIQYALDV